MRSIELNELIIERLKTRDYQNKIDQLLKDIASLDQNQIPNLTKLQKKIKDLKDLLEKPEAHNYENDQVDIWLKSYELQLVEIENQINKKKFANELAQELKSLNLVLTGQYPILKVGFFSLILDYKKDTVQLWYGYEQELIGEYRIFANAREVKKQINNFLKNGGSGLDTNSFIDKLKNAYCYLFEQKYERNKIEIPIIEMWQRMASWEIQSEKFQQEPLIENMRNYSRADFSYDLYKTKKICSQKGLHLTTAMKAFTTQRKDYLWIPNNEHNEMGSVYAFIKFDDKD